MDKNIMLKLVTLLTTIFLAGYTYAEPPAQPVNEDNDKSNLWDSSTAITWYNLQHLSSAKLLALSQGDNDATESAWLQLALINKTNSAKSQELARDLMSWQAHYPTHPANELLPDAQTLNQLTGSTVPQKIAVLLPLSGAFGASGQSIRAGLLKAYYANLTKGEEQSIKFYDTAQSRNMTVLYKKAINEGANFVIGPLTKTDVQRVGNTDSFPIPILALNYTDSQRYSSTKNFYEFGLMPEDETQQMAYHARDAGLSRAIIIAPDDAWGKRLTMAFLNYWKSAGGSVLDTLIYTSQTDFPKDIAALMQINQEEDKKLMHENNNKEVLEQQRRHDFDVIFLFAQPASARIIVPLLRFNYVNDVAIYATSAIFASKPNAAKDTDLSSVIVCDIPWNKNTSSKDRLNAVGSDAYLLSQALPRLKQLPNFPIYAATGALTISSTNQIHRRLPCHALSTGAT